MAISSLMYVFTVEVFKEAQDRTRQSRRVQRSRAYGEDGVPMRECAMGWFEAIVLGIVQGLTEFLPISSSAHLLIVGQLFFGGHDPGAAFTAVSQLGTETAVVVYFFKDIVRIISTGPCH